MKAARSVSIRVEPVSRANLLPTEFGALLQSNLFAIQQKICYIGRVRRRSPSTDFGQHLRSARIRAGINLTRLATRSGVSVSSLSRFEAGASQPGFADACAIAKALGTPLLFLADGRDRTSNDPRDLIAHLAFWGLNDLAPGEVALIGEARPFEGLIAVSLTDAGTPRILESIPALLLKNEFSVAELVAQAVGAGVLHRLGWLAGNRRMDRESDLRWQQAPSGRRFRRSNRCARHRGIVVSRISPSYRKHHGGPTVGTCSET